MREPAGQVTQHNLESARREPYDSQILDSPAHNIEDVNQSGRVEQVLEDVAQLEVFEAAGNLRAGADVFSWGNTSIEKWLADMSRGLTLTRTPLTHGHRFCGN